MVVELHYAWAHPPYQDDLLLAPNLVNHLVLLSKYYG